LHQRVCCLEICAAPFFKQRSVIVEGSALDRADNVRTVVR
jgi:hypothetical protein